MQIKISDTSELDLQPFNFIKCYHFMLWLHNATVAEVNVWKCLSVQTQRNFI